MNLAKQEWRVHIRQINLLRAVEISLGAVETLRHHAELDVACAKNVANLPQCFLHSNVTARVARAVVARKQKL